MKNTTITKIIIFSGATNSAETNFFTKSVVDHFPEIQSAGSDVHGLTKTLENSNGGIHFIEVDSSKVSQVVKSFTHHGVQVLTIACPTKSQGMYLKANEVNNQVSIFLHPEQVNNLHFIAAKSGLPNISPTSKT